MAKLTCSKSGTIFDVQHMPLAFGAPEYDHPLFHVDQKKLISLAGQWAAQRLTPTESYLLYLSLLDSTSLIQWRSHATYHSSTDSIVASNMESLLHIIGKINLIRHRDLTLPSFVISRDTADLSNSGHWIQSWITNYHEWYDSYLSAAQREELKDKLDHREEVLQRMIKSATPPERYASMLADWAAVAGSFPDTLTPHFKSGKDISLSDYWRYIIRCAGDDDKIWQFPRKDIVELIEHCEDHIQHGNIYAHTLMKYLRDGLVKYDSYCGFGDWDLAAVSGTPFTVMSPRADVYDVNMAALALTTPATEPKKSSYRTQFEWFKAWTKWKVSQSQSSGVPK